MTQFSKVVGAISLVIEANESDYNRQCVVLRRSDVTLHATPLRVSKDELIDLQYLVNRAVESLK